MTGYMDSSGYLDRMWLIKYLIRSCWTGHLKELFDNLLDLKQVHQHLVSCTRRYAIEDLNRFFGISKTNLHATYSATIKLYYLSLDKQQINMIFLN